jgi:hypothetical protein
MGKQSVVVKTQKKQARQSRTTTSAGKETETICSNCKMSGHKSARSSKCKNYEPSKDFIMKKKLGGAYDHYTKKVPLENWIKTEYKSLFQRNAIKASAEVRHVVYRAQLFVNYYLVMHKNDIIPKEIYTQNFWSSVFHLILDKEKKVQDKHVPHDLVEIFKTFKISHSRIIYRGTITSGVPNCFPHAAKELATIYTNMTVENFEQRMSKYLYRKLQNKFMVCHTFVYFKFFFKKIINDSILFSVCLVQMLYLLLKNTFTKKYAKWPSGLVGSEKKKDAIQFIESVNTILSRFIHEPMSLESL